METNTIRVKAFVDEAQYQQLLDLEHGSGGEIVHFIKPDAPIGQWLEHTDSTGEMAAVDLPQLSLVMPEGWEKSALLSRPEPGFSIVIFDSDPDQTIIRELRRPLKVHIEDEMAKRQCAIQFPQWVITDEKKEAEAAIFPTRILRLAPGPFRVFHFDPTEIIPAPGAGTICLVTPKDRPDLKVWARQYHDKETAQCTNIERKILQLVREKGISGNVVANASRSDLGFSISAALINGGEIKRTAMTLATSSGAAELIVSAWS